MHTAICMNINDFNCVSVCMCDKLKLCFNKDSRFSNFHSFELLNNKKKKKKKLNKTKICKRYISDYCVFLFFVHTRISLGLVTISFFFIVVVVVA